MPGTRSSGGRNRKSAALHVLQGTFERARHAGDATPDAPAGTPDPRDLAGEARAEWDRMVTRLTALGTLSSVDDAALRRYVTLHAQTEALEAEHTRLTTLSAKLLKQAGRLEGADLLKAIGEIVGLEKLAARHLVQLRHGAMALRQWLVEFALTPLSRGRVKATSSAAPPMDAKKARYLNGLTKRT